MIGGRGHGRGHAASSAGTTTTGGGVGVGGDKHRKASLLFTEEDQQAMGRLKTAVLCHLFHKMCGLLKEMPQLTAICEVMDALEFEILNLVYVDTIENPCDKYSERKSPPSSMAADNTNANASSASSLKQHQFSKRYVHPRRNLQWFHSKTPYHIQNSTYYRLLGLG